jgi:hypothetical protein
MSLSLCYLVSLLSFTSVSCCGDCTKMLTSVYDEQGATGGKEQHTELLAQVQLHVKARCICLRPSLESTPERQGSRESSSGPNFMCDSTPFGSFMHSTCLVTSCSSSLPYMPLYWRACEVEYEPIICPSSSSGIPTNAISAPSITSSTSKLSRRLVPCVLRLRHSLIASGTSPSMLSCTGHHRVNEGIHAFATREAHLGEKREGDSREGKQAHFVPECLAGILLAEILLIQDVDLHVTRTVVVPRHVHHPKGVGLLEHFRHRETLA